MKNILKGNYKIKAEIVDRKSEGKNEFRQKAINSIGGSMVFVERKKMVWLGDDKNEEKNDNQSSRDIEQERSFP